MKEGRKIKFSLLLVLVGLVLFACQNNPLKVDVSDVKVNLNFKSYDDDLFAASGHLEQSISKLQKEYGNFFTLFNYRMIGIGGPDSSSFYPQLKSFLNDTLIVSLKKKVDQRIDKKQLKDEFTDAFKHYRYYFPNKAIPNIYTCVSGLNQSIIVADSLIGISLDKFLGMDCKYYPRLGLPEYKIRNMYPGKIVPDAMHFWGQTEYPISNSASKVIDHMIYQGMLLYYEDAMMPDVPDTVKIGYTKKQLDFCIASEQGMWTYLAEHNLLFSTKRMDIKRYVGDGPYTSSFSPKSPGRVGAWLGWQIVKAYMKKNPKVSLKELMQTKDYLGILNNSGYQPE
ncbi:MAG TPA: hypothetical protein VKA27_11355 [Sunxiuqinia sp.]|nr:hypothetical protein [Sunxiuqinia sp.]